MKRVDAWSVHASNILVGGTGAVYGWMRYFTAPTDPYAVVNHPWQPALQHWHVWTAPLLVFAAGLIWRNHVVAHWKSGRPGGRWSGISLALTLVPMVVSGYLIQTAVGGGWRQAWIIVHVSTSVIWILGYLAHLVTLRRRKRKRQAALQTARGHSIAASSASPGGLAGGAGIGGEMPKAALKLRNRSGRRGRRGSRS